MLLPVINWREWKGKRVAKVVLIGLVGVAGLVGIGTAGYYLWPEPKPKPPPPIDTATPTENAEYAASDDFKRLPMKQRLAWLDTQMKMIDRMGDDEFRENWEKIDESTRARIRENMDEVMHERGRRQINEYHKLPTSEREAYLDERLDEMNRWGRRTRIMFGSRGRGGRGPRGGHRGDRAEAGRRDGAGHPEGQANRRRRGPGGERFREGAHRFMVEQSPDRRAKTVAYFSAMARRRAERGEGGLFNRGRR